jgi:cytoskeletal protein RodZ
MESLGAELKQAREARGVAMREMATRTKISVTALEALERDDFSRLPGGIFGRSFVRAYAMEVGLDPDAIVTPPSGGGPPSRRSRSTTSSFWIDSGERYSPSGLDL